MTDPEPTPPPATPYVPTGGVPPQPARTLSLVSMIAGIVGVFLAVFFGWIPIVGAIFALLVSVAGVVTGHLGQRREPEARPFWLTGLITGYIGAGISVLWLIAWIAIFAAAAANRGY